MSVLRRQTQGKTIGAANRAVEVRFLAWVCPSKRERMPAREVPATVETSYSVGD